MDTAPLALLDDTACSDEQLVQEAIEAQERADAAEAEAGSPHRWRAADRYHELSARGWSTRRIAAECGTNKDAVSRYIRCVERCIGTDTRPTFWQAYKEVTGETGKNLVQSNENEWYTPKAYIDAAREVLGSIDLDPSSSPEANLTVGATAFYTAEDNGLEQSWSGNVWLNPPYGGLAGQFATRLVAEYQARAIKAAILLVNAHCTDTAWFQPLWDHILCFTDHRIDFDSAGREKNTTSTHGSVFVYFGPDVDVFATHFAPFGAVVRRA